MVQEHLQSLSSSIFWLPANISYLGGMRTHVHTQCTCTCMYTHAHKTHIQAQDRELMGSSPVAKRFIFHIDFYFYLKIFLVLRMKNISWMHSLDVRVPVCEEF